MLLFWLAHIVIVPAVFLAALYGPPFYENIIVRGRDLELDRWNVTIAIGYFLGGYLLGAVVTGIHAFGLFLWQRGRGLTLVAVIVSSVLICGGLLLLSGYPAIARGKGAVLLPGGDDFGVTVVFGLTALAFVAVFFLCRPLGLVERYAGN